MTDLADENVNDVPIDDATSHDQSRQATTEDDFISLKDAQQIFLSRGRSITERTLQRYCEKHHIDAQKRITAEGEKWFARRNSVLTRIEELDEFDRLRPSRPAATEPDMSASAALESEPQKEADQARQSTTTESISTNDAAQHSQATAPDPSRQAATGRDGSDPSERERALYEKITTMYEEEISELRKDKMMLTVQLEIKDRQIERFFDGDHDTKTLFGRLQNLMNNLLPTRAVGARYVPEGESIDSGLDRQSGGTAH